MLPSKAAGCGRPQVDRATHSLDLSQQEVDSGRPGGGRPPPPGSLVTGRVTTAGGFGLRLRLAGGFAGTAGLCDIHDTYVANALAGASLPNVAVAPQHACYRLAWAIPNDSRRPDEQTI